MLVQYSPTICVLCIVLYRNCCTLGRITAFPMFIHIVASVSISLVARFIASLVSCRFLVVERLGLIFFLSSIPLYALACVSVASLAPCRSNSTGMSRSRISTWSLFAPCLAKRSLSSFPMVPLCPLTHCRAVLAALFLIKCMAFLKRGAFFIAIHPSFSHVSRCVVSPSITYFESVMIFRGWRGSATFSAAITAAISPTWLDCASPGTRIAWFLWSPGPNHIPLPHLASFFPFFRHAPSVYTVISLDLGIGPCARYLLAGASVSLVGSVNTRKHSARSSLHVIVGSKVISLLSILAISFLIFLVLVRDSPSGGSCLVGLYLGGIMSRRVCASVTHLCGFSQPWFRSFVHSWHGQFCSGRCVGCWRGCRDLADILTRSTTKETLCFFSRHLVALLFIGRCSAVGWYQAGSWARTCGFSLIADRFTLYFLAIFSILLTSSLSLFSLGPLVGTFHTWRKGFPLASLTEWGGAAVCIMWSVIVAQGCRDGVKLRYAFSHMSSIASFLDSMSNRLRPLSSLVDCRLALAILAFASCPHINLLISLVNADSTDAGMPCAFVRNWVCPPITVCMMSFFPFRVGWVLSQLLSFALMTSFIGSQGVASFTSLPIQAPSIL